ncbi:MAG: ATP-dependent helicase [Deltaproteobacteria bacterium]|nr:ATP-dependent helicase [Deltaproteobacteria bacterium]
MNLTEEQQRIVTHQGGHAKVSAVAGSGKSTTMVARVGYLLAQGVEPRHILVLMFNKSARDSFAAAMNDVLQTRGLPRPEVRTFHSLGLRLVHSFTHKGFLPPYTLVTEEYRLEKIVKSAVRRIIDRDEGSEEWLSGENMEGFLTFIDLVKANTLPADKLFHALQLAERFAYFIEAFQLFEDERKAQKIRFYADLIHEPVMAILGNRRVAEWVANHVEHIIVDEYQDINEVQQQLLKTIAGNRAKVMVVGDVDQCIYEWRGAKPEYLTKRFQHDFPGPASYTLSYTFRYGHRLSLAANHLITNNRLRDRKLCLSFPTTRDTELFCLEEKEPHPILAILAELAGQGRAASDVAVLVRMFAMSVPVELALLEAHIPYRLAGHEQVFACPEIRALTGYLRLCLGSLEAAAPDTVLNIIESMLTNPHLGVKREKISKLAAKITRQPNQGPELILSEISRDTPPFPRKRLEQTAETWHEIRSMPPSAKASAVIGQVIKKTNLFGYYRNISARAAVAENRIKTCQAFARFAGRLDLAVEPFLEKIRALEGRQVAAPAGECLLITSIHRAKGLEWPVVVIPGLTDGSFPLLQDDNKEVFADLEDERRLFYVAMTRAKEKVFFLHPEDSRFSSRKKKGSTRFRRAPGDDSPQASRFLYEANLDLSKRLGGEIGQKENSSGPRFVAEDAEVANNYLKAINSGLPLVESPEQPVEGGGEKKGCLDINDLAEGLLVRHPLFGPGVITGVLDRRTGKVRVLFDQHGAKTLIAAIAGLRQHRPKP